MIETEKEKKKMEPESPASFKEESKKNSHLSQFELKETESKEIEASLETVSKEIEESPKTESKEVCQAVEESPETELKEVKETEKEKKKMEPESSASFKEESKKNSHLSQFELKETESKEIEASLETISKEIEESPKTESKEVIETEKEKKKMEPESSASLKEESKKISHLTQFEPKALEEIKNLVQEALKNGEFSGASPSEAENLPEVSIWGVPLMKDDRSDVILLKFLRARNFKVKESLAMLENTMKWRRELNVDELINEEDLGDELEKDVFMHGHNKEGHPVWYTAFGEFQNKELYAKRFSDEEKRKKFLRWKIQVLERSIRKLDFSPGGFNTVFRVSDLKNSPGPGKKELRIVARRALQIFQDNYPEFIAKQAFINVPWWYLAFYKLMNPLLPQRSKSKLVIAGPSKSTETLFKYILPERGLSVDICECNPEFTVDDPASELDVKPTTKKIVEIIVNERCTLVWELRVIGWEVSYSAEYAPNDEHSYTVIIQKTRKILPTDEPVVTNRFNVSESGKILLTVYNPTAKKKKLVYRFKVLPHAS